MEQHQRPPVVPITSNAMHLIEHIRIERIRVQNLRIERIRMLPYHADEVPYDIVRS